MADQSIIRLVAELEIAGATKVTRQIQKIAKDANLAITFDERGFVRQFSRAGVDIRRQMAATMAAALKAGISTQALDSIRKSYLEISREMYKAQVDGARDSAKLAEEERKKREKAEIEAERKRHVARRKAAEDIRKIVSGGAKGGLGYMLGGGFADSLSWAMGSAKGGDLSGLLQGAGGRSKDLGQKSADSAKRLSDLAEKSSGRTAKLAKSMSGLLSKLGPVLMGLGAMAGAIAAVVKIIVDADSHVKGFNRTLLSSGVAAADLVDQLGGVERGLDGIRGAFMTGDGAFSFNRIWGTDAKDHVEILGAYAQAGLTFQEITQGTNDAAVEMERLRGATEKALTYSKLLGESTTQIAQNMAEFMEDWGVGLGGIEERFSMIAAAARESGFATKRFYGMVLQATGGMAGYNVRLEDTLGMLTMLSKVLTPKEGAEFFNKLGKSYQDKPIVERRKEAMLLGDYGKILSKMSSVSSARDVIKLMKEAVAEGAPQAEKIKEVLSEAKLLDLDPDKLAQKISEMGAVRFNAIYTKLFSLNEGLGQKFWNLRRDSVGRSGEAGDVAASMAGFGATETILGKMFKLHKFFQGRGIERIDQVEYGDNVMEAAVETVGEISPKEFEEIRRIGGTFEGFRTTLRETLRELKTTSDPQGLVKGFNEQFEKLFQVTLTRSGELISTVDQKNIDPWGQPGFLNLVANASRTMFQGTEDDVKEDILLAQIIAGNTTDMTKVLEQGVSTILGDIYEAVLAIKEWLIGGREGRERRVRQTQEAASRVRQVRGERNELQGRLAGLQRKLAGGGLSPEERTKLQGEAGEVRAALQKKDAQLGVEMDRMRNVRLHGSAPLSTEQAEKHLDRLAGKDRAAEIKGQADAVRAKVLRDRGQRVAGSIAPMSPLMQTGTGGAATSLGGTLDPDEEHRRVLNEAVGREIRGETALEPEVGPVSRGPALGPNKGTPVTVTNHFYNDGQGIWNSMRKYNQAMGFRLAGHGMA